MKNTLRKIVAGTLLGAALACSEGERKPAEILESRLHLESEYGGSVVMNPDRFDLDGDGTKDLVYITRDGAYFKSGSEPNGRYRLVKSDTDLGSRMNEYYVLQLDGIGFPDGFEQKGYRY